MKPFFKKKLFAGQTVTEVAIFGAILLFVVGAIVQQAMNSGNQQNIQLKALRMALKTSWEYSEGFKGYNKEGRDKGDVSRNSTSLIVIEDRLSSGASRYGIVDRVPMAVGAGGTHSRHLFRPIKPVESENKQVNLPVMDIFVNGKHFPLTVAKYKIVNLSYPADLVMENWRDCTGGTNPREDWMDCTDGTDPIEDKGCMLLCKAIPNDPEDPNWCVDGDACPLLTAAQRFDLDRDGNSDVPAGNWPYFAWQWAPVLAYDNGYKNMTEDDNEDKYLYYYPNGDIDGWWDSLWHDIDFEPTRKLTVSSWPAINLLADENAMVDVDGDLKEEGIKGILDEDEDGIRDGVIRRIVVVDFQDGDIDTTWEEGNERPRPGLQNEVRMYTLIKDKNSPQGGTYLRMDEGKLFIRKGNEEKYLRSIRAKDQANLVSRFIQLSNDTGRFCKRDGDHYVVQDDTNIWVDVPNPIEVCCDSSTERCYWWDDATQENKDIRAVHCSDTGTIDKTCLDMHSLTIYVRSKVADMRRRKWITDTSRWDIFKMKAD